jgi:ATP-binding cassette subfamily C protein CydC
MALGTGLGLLALACAVGLLALSGWFISAAAYAGLTAATALLFNFFHPSIGVRTFAIGRTLARYAERIVTHDVTFRILQSLRSWFYIHLEPLAPARLMMFRSGDVLNRIVSDIDALDNLYLRVLSPTIIAVMLSIAVVGFLGLFDPLIALGVALILVVAGLGIPAAALRLGKPVGQNLIRHSSKLRIHVVDALQGLPELLVFGAHRQQIETVEQSSQALIRCQLRMSHIRGFSSALITLFSGLAVIVALYLGVLAVNRHTLDGPALAMVMLTVMASFEAIAPLPLAYQFLGQTQEAARRLLEMVNVEPLVQFPDRPGPAPEPIGIGFDNVSFRYQEDAPWALKRVDIDVPAGSRVAIIGETGSGKTTLLQLLVRFWNPDSGRIHLGGRSIDSFREADLRRLITTVSQQPHLFNTTLKENLLMAKPDAEDDELWDALKTVQLLEFVAGLPDGLNTWLGEAGHRLSGGQARRVAVARAVLHNAPLWILDEPTEGLDPITEKKMMQALKVRTAGRTLMMITHRLIDLDWMDYIVMLDRGRVIARGSHAELLKTSPRYADLYMRVRH